MGNGAVQRLRRDFDGFEKDGLKPMPFTVGNCGFACGRAL
jgi:hypothetical protein